MRKLWIFMLFHFAFVRFGEMLPDNGLESRRLGWGEGKHTFHRVRITKESTAKKTTHNITRLIWKWQWPNICHIRTYRNESRALHVFGLHKMDMCLCNSIGAVCIVCILWIAHSKSLWTHCVCVYYMFNHTEHSKNTASPKKNQGKNSGYAFYVREYFLCLANKKPATTQLGMDENINGNNTANG